MAPDQQPGLQRPGTPSLVRHWWGNHALLQVLGFLSLAALVWLSSSNVAGTMQRLGIAPGFAFLGRAANFAIGYNLIDYNPADTYGRAILVGVLNTLLVAGLGCMLATILGVALGVARFSENRLLTGLVQAYVELMRNTPLLLQLFFWSGVAHALPAPRQAFSLFDEAYLSNRGAFLPSLAFTNCPSPIWLLALVLPVTLAIRQFRRGRTRQGLLLWGGSLAAFLAYITTAYLAGGRISVDIPTLKGFNIVGGASLPPEFVALLVGLTVNAAATVSEIVRSGIQSVEIGQWEAARAAGFKHHQIIRLIVLPQAMRVITPLMTSVYLDLTKNSSLAVAIGFPDLVSVINTTANQTGQAFEAIAILVGVFLFINLSVSALINRYNRRIIRREGRHI